MHFLFFDHFREGGFLGYQNRKWSCHTYSERAFQVLLEFYNFRKFFGMSFFSHYAISGTRWENGRYHRFGRSAQKMKENAYNNLRVKLQE